MSRAGRTEPPAGGEAGYTYAALLIVLVGLGLTVETAFIPPATEARRADEAELIFRGMAYRRAIESYYLADPGVPEFPPNLDALLEDPREEGRRHIRRLYEPVIASDWDLIEAEGGGIAGVVPESELTAFRRAGFPEGMEVAEEAEAYTGWRFVFDPDENEDGDGGEDDG